MESDEAVMHEARRTAAQLGLLTEGQRVNRIVVRVAPHRRLVNIVTKIRSEPCEQCVFYFCVYKSSILKKDSTCYA